MFTGGWRTSWLSMFTGTAFPAKPLALTSIFQLHGLSPR
jgi:hypothetical protein